MGCLYPSKKQKNMKPTYTSTRNACKLCAPLGASLVFKGIEGCVPLIHGSQGCATYIRRYMISHYKEPVDIASSNFSEETTVFGGNKNFITGINNIRSQYHPDVVGIASTCLSETIGEDVPGLIREYGEVNAGTHIPRFVNASTPSYCGTHMDGFHHTVTATLKAMAQAGTQGEHINILPGFVSPADLRYLKEVLEDFGIDYVLFPDYSENLDNVHTREYQLIPSGGTPVRRIEMTGTAKATIEFGTVFNKGAVRTKGPNHIESAGEYLQRAFDVPNHQMRMPIGIDASDKFFDTLAALSGRPVPEKYQKERGRLIDAYVDAHKYVFGKRAALYGEEDLVLGMVGFFEEIGVHTVLASSGGESGLLKREVDKLLQTDNDTRVVNGMDFASIREEVKALAPDFLIGNSKGYYISRELQIPLVRIGFPIHDRFGAARIHHIGYRGTQELFDRVVNAIIEYKQEHASVAYKYI